MIKIDINVFILKYTVKKIPDLGGLEFWKDGDWVLYRTYTYISTLRVLFVDLLYCPQNGCSSEISELS